MLVDSFRFLPRSFAPLYASAEPVAGEEEVLWAPFERRLADARIALVSSAGLFLEEAQEPFDVERERREPTWGDPSYRVIPADRSDQRLGMTHLHVNSTDVLADPEIALPTGALAALAAEGVIAGPTDRHVSVMGYQEAGVEAWRTRTGPEVAALLRDEGADGVILAPV
jgi:D-proline reductase (dithiol) PrdB